ncbi:MAG: glycosyltransferase family 2 protein [Aureispira sp.]|nr:glycosyltransferase family 2 protein [Aureispira sp.]
MDSSVYLSIIIPFLNEEENIETLLTTLREYLDAFPEPVEVVLVDDGSTDQSVAKIKEHYSKLERIRLVQLSRNFGSLAALRAGVEVASGERVMFLYADLQDPPTLIARLHERMEEGYDIVWASRSKEGQSFRERLFPRFYAWLMQKYAVADFPENGFDVVMFNHKIKNQLNKRQECHSSIFLQILEMGFKKSSITYEKVERQKGQSKWTFAKKFKLVVDSFVAFSYFPIRLVTIIGLLMALGGMVWIGIVVFLYFWGVDTPLGWPTLMSAVLIGCGITNFSLGIIAEYLWRTYDAARNTRPFIIDEVTEFD